ncbi:unnamed protein product [Brassica oleracea]
MWVLQDSEKHEWSKHIYILPPLWKHISGGQNLYFVGVTGADEIVVSQIFISRAFLCLLLQFEEGNYKTS